MELTLGLALTLALLVGNGFFVAAEFALVAAKRPRLETAAAGGSRAAASAVAGIRELSVMLAGAQLGITMCSLGLGLVSEPVLAGTFAPWLEAVGLPGAAAHGVAFVVALGLVTFLHMVVGEMAPKTWAITYPERSATVLALPFRAFTRVVHPVLTSLNAVTNLLLRVVGVPPRDALEVSRTPEQLRDLARESRRLGLIEEWDLRVLTAALDAPETPLSGLVIPLPDVDSVDPDADPQRVLDVAAETGRIRLLVRGVKPDGAARMVHVRDAYLARARSRTTRADDLAHPVPSIPVGTAVAHAVAVLREARSGLGLVVDASGRPVGVISLDDLLATLVHP